MTTRTPVFGYSLAQILLHWSIAGLVVFQIVSGEAAEEALDAMEEGGAISAADQGSADWHRWLGATILVLTLVRIALKLTRGAPKPPEGMGHWAARLATAVHHIFYALLVIVPISGLLTWYVNPEIGDIHALAKPVFIVLILLHAGAALWHHFALKDGLLLRMLAPKRVV